ncbi:MAG TPA: FeoA family protein [Clostridia bacterium]
MSIYDLKIGQTALIIGVSGVSSKKLTELGFVKGTKVTLLNIGLFGGRLIKFRDCVLGLRSTLAKNIEVKCI